MTILSFGNDGVEAITLVNNPAPDFRPLTDSEAFLDSSFFWAALPDDYDDLPADDRRVVEAAWKAVIQYGAGALTEIAHLDQTSSIIDFPIRMQRKWQCIETLRTVDAGGGAAELNDATTSSKGAALLRSPEVVQDTTLRLTPGNVHVGAYIELDGEVSSSARLTAAITLQLRGNYAPADYWLAGPPALATSEQWFVFGYGDLSQERMAPGAYVAMSTQRRLAALVVRPDRTSRWAISYESVDVDSFDGGVRLLIHTTPLDEGVRVTAEVETAGEGPNYKVSLVEPVSFSAKHVALTTVDSRVRVDSPNAGEVIGERAPFTAVLGTIQYTDPSVHSGARSIPTLQASVGGSPTRYQQSVDYEVAWDDIAGTAEIRWFRPLPTEDLWAPVVAMDNRLIEKIWGPFTSSRAVSGPDTAQLRNLLAAVMYGLMGGPHLRPLSAAVGALSGAPMCVEDGVVIAVDVDPDSPVIVVRGFDKDRRYYYPPGLKRTVGVGSLVTKLQMLCEIPVLRDWTSGEELTSRLRLGDPVHALIRSEMEKYSALHIEIPAGAVGVSREFEGRLNSLPARLTEYLGDALSIWMGSFRMFLALVHSIGDQLPLDDYTDYAGVLSIRTPLTNARDPRYNESERYAYDGTLVYNEGTRDILRDRLEVVANNSGPSAVIHIFGADYTLATATPITVPEYV